MNTQTTKTQYWVTEIPWGKEGVNDQMRFLNQLNDADDGVMWELVGVDASGRYILKGNTYEA